jgi:hypothetical protein
MTQLPKVSHLSVEQMEQDELSAFELTTGRWIAARGG